MKLKKLTALFLSAAIILTFTACGLSLDADTLMRVKSVALSATSSVDSVYMGGEQLCGVIEKITIGEKFEYKNFLPKIWVLPDEVEDYASESGISIQ